MSHFFTAPEDTSIVFCNRPATADKVAGQISSNIEGEIDDEELSDFADFLEVEVHRLYRLAAFVRKGIAFHYSNIPQIVRGRIEELVKEKTLRFICCTSTLLQGMNMPAKNIFVENPKSGAGKVMDAGDFWNLVGRAGRLNHEFTGNVFCVFSKNWDSNPMNQDKLVAIESAFEVAVTERTRELAFFCNEPPLASESDQEWAEQAIASIYSNYLTNGSRIQDRAGDNTFREFAQKIDVFCESFKKTLPASHYEQNLYVHPKRLEDLAEFLRSRPRLDDYLPVVPMSNKSYDRLLAIFQVIEDFFIREGTRRHEYFAVLANLWMQGTSLRELIRDRLKRRNITNDVDAVNEQIRLLFIDIEQSIRYIYVKYVTIYFSVLSAVLVEKDRKEDAEAIIPIHLFLEFGASSKTMINLMSLGLSRTSAIILRSSVRFRDDLEIQGCREYLAAVDLQRSDLPNVCKAEIRRLRGA
jgi:hypothetical protein